MLVDSVLSDIRRLVAMKIDYAEQTKGRSSLLRIDIYLLLFETPPKEKSLLPTMGPIKNFGCKTENAVSTAQSKESWRWEIMPLNRTPCASVSQLLSVKILEVALIPSSVLSCQDKDNMQKWGYSNDTVTSICREPGPFEHGVVHALLKVSVSGIDLARPHTG